MSCEENSNNDDFRAGRNKLFYLFDLFSFGGEEVLTTLKSQSPFQFLLLVL